MDDAARRDASAATHRCASTRCISARGAAALETGTRSPTSWATTSASLGFTHVELLPVAEHPFGGSWGYQVSGYYAPTARFGEPERACAASSTRMHQRGIGVIVDWVPAHFPRDEWSLGRFDGTPLYEHPDPRRGEHPEWGTYVFDFGRNQVRNFLVANALYWLDEFHIDGLRVDAVASMLYLDYSRDAGGWVPNEFGGRENLDAIRVPPRDEHGRRRGVPRRVDDRRGVDGVAGRDRADVGGRSRLQPQVEPRAGCTTRSATSRSTRSIAVTTTTR